MRTRVDAIHRTRTRGPARPRLLITGAVGLLAVLPLAATGPGASPARPTGFPFTVETGDADRYRDLLPPAGSRGPLLRVKVEVPGLLPVPSALVVHLVREQRERTLSWRWLDARRLDGGGSVDLVVGDTPEYARCLLVAQAEATDVYSLSAPFACPRTDTPRALTLHPRRTIGGRLPGDALDDGSEPVWLDATPDAAGFTPSCRREASATWSCVGVPASVPGVVLLRVMDPVVYSRVAATDPGPSPQQVGDWAVQVCFDASSLSPDGGAPALPPGTLKVEVLHPGRGRGRLFSTDAAAQIAALGHDCFWVAASIAPGEETVRVQGDDVATMYLPVATLLTAEPTTRRTVFLQAPITLSGSVTASAEISLEGAVVSLFSSPPTTGDGEGDRPGQHLAEVEVDARDRFAFDNLAPGTYFVRACHASSGCAEGTYATGGEPPRLRLRAERQIRGRVTSRGRPLGDIAVRLSPTLATYQDAKDPTGLFGAPGANTDSEGHFAVALPATGSFRLAIESGEYGSAFRLVGPMETQPETIDLGDVALALPVRLSIEFPACPAGRIVLIGPQGDAAATPSLLKGVLDDNGRGWLDLPSSGTYIPLAECGARTIDDDLQPASIEVPPDVTELSVIFEVRDDPM